MRRPTRYLWLPLAGLVFAGLAPSTARASCGHYVLVGSPLKESGQQAQSAKSSEAGQHQAPAPLPSGPRPCSGPGCSQGDEPFLPLPTTPSAEEERWGHNPFTISHAEQPLDFLSLSLSAARPVRPASSVYHPPRGS